MWMGSGKLYRVVELDFLSLLPRQHQFNAILLKQLNPAYTTFLHPRRAVHSFETQEILQVPNINERAQTGEAFPIALGRNTTPRPCRMRALGILTLLASAWSASAYPQRLQQRAVSHPSLLAAEAGPTEVRVGVAAPTPVDMAPTVSLSLPFATADPQYIQPTSLSRPQPTGGRIHQSAVQGKWKRPVPTPSPDDNIVLYA